MSPDYATFHPGNVQPGSQSGQFRVSNLKPEHPSHPGHRIEGTELQNAGQSGLRAPARIRRC